MTKFNIGDRVRYIGDFYESLSGSFGFVKETTDYPTCPYRVVLDGSGYGYPCRSSEIEAVSSVDDNGQYLMEL